MSYDRAAAARDKKVKPQWKLDARAAFLERVKKGRLLEIGAGTGDDSVFFKKSGLEVVATDLSAEMVALCRAKGVNAYEMDFLSLEFPEGSFDAIYAMLCLLHVPSSDLDQVLRRLKALLRPDGLLFVGVYGGQDEEGLSPNDDHDPPRFFSFRSDETLLAAARKHFEVVDFHVVEPEDFHFQSLTLRRSDTVNAS